MAVFDKQLGNNATAAGGASITLTAANAVASGGFVELVVSWFGLASLPTITVTGTNGLTWTTDKATQTANTYGTAILSAQAPSGVATSATYIATFSSSPTESYIAGFSFTGVATSAPVTGTPNAATATTTANWTGGSTTPAVAAHVTGVAITDAGAGTSTPGGGGSSPTTGWTEVPTTAGDWNNGTHGVSLENIYRLDGAASSAYNAGGVFSLSGSNWGISVAYKDAPTSVEAGLSSPFRPLLMKMKPLWRQPGLGFPLPQPAFAAAVTTDQALTATVTTTASVATLKAVAVAMTATVTSTASIVKQVGKRLTATATSTATIVKSVGKLLTANATVTASMATIKAILVTLTATVTSTASLVKRVNKNVTATVTSTATVTRQVLKRLTATVTSTASMAVLKAVLVTLTATATVTASVAKRVNKTLLAAASVLGLLDNGHAAPPGQPLPGAGGATRVLTVRPMDIVETAKWRAHLDEEEIALILSLI